MSLEYAEGRIKEALRLSGGNRLKARQQIIAWTYEDNKLLHALAKPHLSGIVAYNVERVDSGRAEAMKAPPPVAEPKPAPLRQQQTAPKKNTGENAPRPASKAPDTSSFGLEILKAATGSRPTMFGLEDTGAPKKRQGVSQSHIDTIKSLASEVKIPTKNQAKKSD